MPLAEQFATAHEQRYGYRQAGADVEAVTVRVTAVAPLVVPRLPTQPAGSANASAAIVGQKPVWFGREPRPATLYARERLRPGNTFAGPAVIFQYDTTTVIPPGWQVTVDPFSNLVVTAG
jgi:N-methylhydantoinase A